MVIKKKTSPRKPRKTVKSRKSSLWFPITVVNLFLLTVSAGFFYISYHPKSWPVSPETTDPATILESILVASNVKLGSDLETFVVKDGTQHWKAHVDKEQRKRILNSLKHLGDQKVFELKIGEAKTIKDKILQLVTISKENKVVLKFILSLNQAEKIETESKISIPSKPDHPEEQPAPFYWESYDGPKIAIIIDDVGMKPVSEIQELLDLEIPITFAILPFQRYSTSSAEALNRDHYEIMLHMPMEPTNFPVTNPGAGAVFASFSQAKAKATLLEALESISHISGINNHMGSKITSSRPLMGAIMEVIREQDLYFVDSRTHASTVAYDVARESSVRAAKRDVFLDATMSYEFTRNQLLETGAIARKTGFAVAIGHPHPSTIAALSDAIPGLKSQGFSFVFTSQVVTMNTVIHSASR